MNFDKAEINEEDIGITDGGYRYINIDTEKGELKLRESIKPHRLTEDDETYDEYLERRATSNLYIKELKKGQMNWPSNLWGTKTQEKVNILKSNQNEK